MKIKKLNEFIKINEDLIDSPSLCNRFIKGLENNCETCVDLSDIGNAIGLTIGEYFSKELGFEKDDFLNGIKHGISLTDGTTLKNF